MAKSFKERNEIIDESVIKLSEMAKASVDSLKALQWSQSAQNLANTKRTLLESDPLVSSIEAEMAKYSASGLATTTKKSS